MRKRLLLFVLCIAMVVGNVSGLTLVSTAAPSESDTEVSYLEGSDLLYDLMEFSTTFVLAQHKALGGSHYAYTEGLFEESTGDSPEGTESNFVAGSRLVLIKLEAEGNQVKKTETVILKSPMGCIRDPDVSADGTKVIFSWKQRTNDDFHLYEMELTSGEYEYKQLTFGSGVADIECQYLPNGEIIFNSTRAVQTVDCWKTPVSNLYKCSADGSNIIRLGYDQVHTTLPSVTSDGRVIYTRWDYNDRTQMWIQSLFQMNPDGTNQTELYGNNSNFPTTLTHVREVPGTNGLYMAIATGHHTFQGGKLCFVDVTDERDGKNSVTFPFPDVGTNKNDSVDIFGQAGPIYQYPYPINSEEFLVSYSPSGWAANKAATPFSIYLMNTDGDKIELVEGTSAYPCAQIVAVKTRDMFVRPSMVNYAMTTGTYYVADVYQGEAMNGVERGAVKQIRVVALDYRAYAIGATVASGSGSADPFTPIATGNGSWDVKVVLGVATVYEDGSAMFSVPSETPVYFQLLDEDGNMIQTMRSWSTLMPNEIYSCVGCHEDNNTAPPASSRPTMAMEAGVEELKPDVWQQDDEDYDPYTSKIGFSYIDEIQTIFDKSCVSCHNDETAAYMEINVDGMNNSGVEATIKGEEIEIFPIGSTWKYKISTTDSPVSGWNTLGFDDSSWASGKGPFGDRNENGVTVATPWNGSNNYIWIRKTFTIEDADDLKNAYLMLRTWYDDNPVFYLNGTEIFRDTEGNAWVDNYTTINLGTKYNHLLKEGENVIAIYCKNTSGGRQIDTSLYFLKPDLEAGEEVGQISLEGTLINSDRMKKSFPLSYLVLTASRPNGSVQWVGTSTNKYINWISSMSGAEIIDPYTYGAITSPLIERLRDGHGNLSETEIRTIAAWIDLTVPCYGEYDVNNNWNADAKQEAEEEQNKRDYYTMLNDYARMSLAGTLPTGLIKATYKSTRMEVSGEANGILTLYVGQKYRKGDTITVTLPEGEKYIGFTLTAKMGESIIYCPDGTFTYVIPSLASMVSTISQSYANTTNNITIRLLTDEELAEKRNLAENSYDYTNNASQPSDITGQYPHATASSEWENTKGDLDFLARNAIDGFTNNKGHGAFPVQSWGPATTPNQWFAIDFGREVNAEELGIFIRYDVSHDTYFKSGVIEFTYADGTTSTQRFTLEWTGDEQIIELEATKPIVSIKLKNLVADKRGSWAAFSEVRVYGTEKQ